MSDVAYENTLSIDQLRREVRECWDREHAIRDALIELPEQPPYEVQLFLGEAAKWPDDKDLGKAEQRRLGGEAVWYKTEIELGAGLWARIRDSLRAARADAPTS